MTDEQHDINWKPYVVVSLLGIIVTTAVAASTG
jgi:hypothetical protein